MRLVPISGFYLSGRRGSSEMVLGGLSGNMILSSTVLKQCSCRHWLCAIIACFEIVVFVINRIPIVCKTQWFAITILGANPDWSARHARHTCMHHSHPPVVSHVSASPRPKFARISRICHSIYHGVDARTTVRLARCCKCPCATRTSKTWTLNVKPQSQSYCQKSITELSMRNDFACANAWNASRIERVSIIFNFHTWYHVNYTCIFDNSQ